LPASPEAAIAINDKIAPLLKLQEIDLGLSKALDGTVRLGPAREEQKALAQKLAQEFEDSKKMLTQLQVEKKSLELDIEAKDGVTRKSSGELNSAKSNDTYKALLSQIEEAKKAKAQIEDKVLEIMEKMDVMQRESKAREKKFQEDKAAVEKKIAEIDTEEQRLKDEAAAKKAERDAYFQTLPESSQKMYDRVQRGRQSMAVLAPVVNGTCGGCHMLLPQGVIVTVTKGLEFCTCEGCTRLLYALPKEDKPAEAQNAGASAAN
jgi:predicted  nucleic acid-binding Zn-ribbon protein